MNRLAVILPACAFLLIPVAANAQITCAQLPKAEAYVNEQLRPGPNTTQAKRHIALAKRARSERACVAELKKVDYYAKKSAAADKRAASRHHYNQ